MSKLSQLFMLCYCPFIKFQTNEVQDALLNWNIIYKVGFDPLFYSYCLTATSTFWKLSLCENSINVKKICKGIFLKNVIIP